MHPTLSVDILETLPCPFPLPDITEWKKNPVHTFRMVATVISAMKVVRYLRERGRAISFEEKLAGRLACEEAGKQLLHLADRVDELTPAGRQLIMLLSQEIGECRFRIACRAVRA